MSCRLERSVNILILITKRNKNQKRFKIYRNIVSTHAPQSSLSCWKCLQEPHALSITSRKDNVKSKAQNKYESHMKTEILLVSMVGHMLCLLLCPFLLVCLHSFVVNATIAKAVSQSPYYPFHATLRYMRIPKSQNQQLQLFMTSYRGKLIECIKQVYFQLFYATHVLLEKLSSFLNLRRKNYIRIVSIKIFR